MRRVAWAVSLTRPGYACVMAAAMLSSPTLAQPSFPAIDVEFIIYALAIVIWVGSWLASQVVQHRKKAKLGGALPENSDGDASDQASNSVARVEAEAETLDPVEQIWRRVEARRQAAEQAKQTEPPTPAGELVERAQRPPHPSGPDADARAGSPTPTAGRPTAPPRRPFPPRRPGPGMATTRPDASPGGVPPQRGAPRRPLPPRPQPAARPTAPRPAPAQPSRPSTGAAATAPPQAPPPVMAYGNAKRRHHAAELLGALDRDALRRAILLRELLDPPVSLRPPDQQPGMTP